MKKKKEHTQITAEEKVPQVHVLMAGDTLWDVKGADHVSGSCSILSYQDKKGHAERSSFDKQDREDQQRKDESSCPIPTIHA